ncbi:hypothetical protein C8034_v002732 [Colletotrichum sidae]|uniref:DUF6594 domain-containing protein n=1 Tax=Colletotrichum sidae TaxID=1347389 RepID=A0A4R8TB72_9PEZI|nr:hypothetical protein C8034_v002732 [Colletotrichum sidae]
MRLPSLIIERDTVGYTQFIEFMASDDDILVLRRFDTAHIRVLVHLQDQIHQLEGRLESVEQRRSSESVKRGKQDAARGDPETEKVINEMRMRLGEYGTSFPHTYTASVKDRMPAPRLNVQNVATWLDNRGDPISSEEVGFVKDNDQVSLAAAEKPPIRRLFEEQILARTRGLWGLFSSRRGQQQRDDGLRTTV